LAILSLFIYVFASIGWKRYYFVGLAVSAVFVGKMILDIINGFGDVGKVQAASERIQDEVKVGALRVGLGLWVTAMILLPLAKNVQLIISPSDDSPQKMAAYLEANVDKNIVIETWEAELGFLTDHAFHYPPNEFLALLNQHVWQDGPPVSQYYVFPSTEIPEFILIGHTGQIAGAYHPELLSSKYSWVFSVGEYTLFKKK
jgi:hypothetical protein